MTESADNIHSTPDRIDVIIPLFNEEKNLPELVDRLRSALDEVENIAWRVIFVDDGSRDQTSSMLDDLYQEDNRLTAVHLSRNFGHQAAITAGVAHATGDAVITMDGDLQDPPEAVPEMIDTWRQGAQVVRAQRRRREEHGGRAIGFMLFHRFFHLVSGTPIPPRVGIFGLMDRQATRVLQRLGERNRFFPGLRWWIGFEQQTVYYDRQDRAAGEPKQTFLKLVMYGLDAIFSFSYRPLRMVTLAGLATSLAGGLLAAWFIFKRLTGMETADTGFTTLVTLILLLGGAQIAAVGVVGEYMARISDEVKERPLYVVGRRSGVEAPDHG